MGSCVRVCVCWALWLVASFDDVELWFVVWSFWLFLFIFQYRLAIVRGSWTFSFVSSDSVGLCVARYARGGAKAHKNYDLTCYDMIKGINGFASHSLARYVSVGWARALRQLSYLKTLFQAFFSFSVCHLLISSSWVFRTFLLRLFFFSHNSFINMHRFNLSQWSERHSTKQKNNNGNDNDKMRIKSIIESEKLGHIFMYLFTFRL